VRVSVLARRVARAGGDGHLGPAEERARVVDAVLADAVHRRQRLASSELRLEAYRVRVRVLPPVAVVLVVEPHVVEREVLGNPVGQRHPDVVVSRRR